MKKTIVMIWLMLLLIIVGALFWYNEWVYQLPTPVPKNYKTVNIGEVIELNSQLKKLNNNPLFLHFFNPDCPCSRFNIKNFKSLVAQYKTQVNFIVVVVSHKTFTVNSIQNKFNLDIPILFDNSIASSCGVYSTPQAVLIDKEHKLYYRGNYNRSRYCTDEKTNYAKMAITGLLNQHTRLTFSQFALKAYGCQLPDCTQ
ncbi:MAG: redoxin family protein [Candidatus Pedobacter colombiensis]|uniref:Redoxin family protein n=1 Tax=Candidatus Pedobacter colombiensis TaxID=3121371 RepID=A0AAJ5W4A9_9SPHI|nr:redoxin family protein [Pedobacter sp.]WEK17707.1 MAG: redoxin family protein [Pedobacter sp.]